MDSCPAYWHREHRNSVHIYVCTWKRKREGRKRVPCPSEFLFPTKSVKMIVSPRMIGSHSGRTRPLGVKLVQEPRQSSIHVSSTKKYGQSIQTACICAFCMLKVRKGRIPASKRVESTVNMHISTAKSGDSIQPDAAFPALAR